MRTPFRNLLCACSAALVAAGCTPPAGSAGSTAGTPGPVMPSAGEQQHGWRVGTEEQVDLWLHGFAMLTSDTGHVPFFLRGYRQEITALKRQRNVYTNLDANQQQLSQGFVRNPALTNAQFLAMYFTSFQEIVNAVDLFVRVDGNPRAASDPIMQQEIALLAANFPTQADRNWVRLFVQSLQDENDRFYHAYWVSEQTTRGAAFAQVNQLWIGQFYPKLSRFLNNTQQQAGELLLSLPLGGEGRTVNNGKQMNLIAVEFPRTPDEAQHALFGFVHEAVASVVQEAITDNTTPAEQRAGTTAAYVGNGAVRGGLLLLQRVAPDLAPAYMRYYLATLGRTASGDPRGAFEAAFPLPAAIVNAISAGIESALGGI
jgi:hypothetical protein